MNEVFRVWIWLAFPDSAAAPLVRPQFEVGEVQGYDAVGHVGDVDASKSVAQWQKCCGRPTPNTLLYEPARTYGRRLPRGSDLQGVQRRRPHIGTK